MLGSNFVTFPIEENLKLGKNGNEDKVDVTLFKYIVCLLRYLYNNRPYIGFLVGLVSK